MPRVQERALFVFDDVQQAVELAGGTLARFAEDGGSTLLVCRQPASADDEIAVTRLSGGAVVTGSAAGTLIDESFAGAVPDALVVADSASADPLVERAVQYATTLRTPVYAAVTTEAEAASGDLRTIDIARQFEGKADALTALGALPPTASVERFIVAVPVTEGEERIGWGTRISAAVLAFAVGAAFGAIGTVAHGSSVDIAGVTLPWGIVVSMVGVVALLVGLRLVVHDRLVIGACALGLVGMIVLLSLRGTGGSVLIQQSVGGYVWLLGPPIIAALVLAWPNLPARGARSTHPAHA
ncbi:MAG: hypothetical protein ABWY36_08225 [Leifsonia sp.]